MAVQFRVQGERCALSSHDLNEHQNNPNLITQSLLEQYQENEVLVADKDDSRNGLLL